MYSRIFANEFLKKFPNTNFHVNSSCGRTDRQTEAWTWKRQQAFFLPSMRTSPKI